MFQLLFHAAGGKCSPSVRLDVPNAWERGREREREREKERERESDRGFRVAIGLDAKGFRVWGESGCRFKAWEC